MALKCIPLNLDWCGDTKHDFHAIYARRKQDNWGTPHLDAMGREQWDATSPLPMRQHMAWEKKGFRYITLAITRDDHRWGMVANWIRQSTGENPEDYIQDRRTRSTFNPALWVADADRERQQALEALRAQVAKFGAEAVVEIRRQTDPTFTLPADLYSELTDEPASVAPAAQEHLSSAVVRRGPGRPRKTEAVA